MRTATIGLADRLRPRVPKGDDLDAASAVLNQVLAWTNAMTDDLRTIGDRHFDTAPASSQHVSELVGAISRTVLDWIERWPA